MKNKPDFRKVSLKFTKSEIQSKQKGEEETSQSIETLLFKTNEEILTKPLYTEQDLIDIQHLGRYLDFLRILEVHIQQCM